MDITPAQYKTSSRAPVAGAPALLVKALFVGTLLATVQGALPRSFRRSLREDKCSAAQADAQKYCPLSVSTLCDLSEKAVKENCSKPATSKRTSKQNTPKHKTPKKTPKLVHYRNYDVVAVVDLGNVLTGEFVQVNPNSPVNTNFNSWVFATDGNKSVNLAGDLVLIWPNSIVNSEDNLQCLSTYDGVEEHLMIKLATCESGAAAQHWRLYLVSSDGVTGNIMVGPASYSDLRITAGTAELMPTDLLNTRSSVEVSQQIFTFFRGPAVTISSVAFSGYKVYYSNDAAGHQLRIGKNPAHNVLFNPTFVTKELTLVLEPTPEPILVFRGELTSGSGNAIVAEGVGARPTFVNPGASGSNTRFNLGRPYWEVKTSATCMQAYQSGPIVLEPCNNKNAQRWQFTFDPSTLNNWPPRLI